MKHLSSNSQSTVSIQLMSPASGDPATIEDLVLVIEADRFHSINVPSEWGRVGTVVCC